MQTGIEQSDWDAVAQERENPETTTQPPAQETPPVQPVEAQPTEKTVDPYEGLHPEVRTKLKPQPGAGPTQTQITAAAKDPEKWAALKSDFPEWGEGISEYVEARLGQLTGSGLSAEQIEQLVAQRADEKTA